MVGIRFKEGHGPAIMRAMMHKCPLCRQETSWTNNPYRPFCSERCQVLDLGAWISEAYAVPEDESEHTSLSDENSDERQDDID